MLKKIFIEIRLCNPMTFLKEILNKLYAKELNGIMYSFADILPFLLPTF